MFRKQLEDTLCRERICESDWLILQARDIAELARQTSNPSLLVFSCLEARNAVEQLWFELLMVIYGGSMERDLFNKCKKRRDGFLAAIHEAEPQYRLLAQFTALCIKLDAKATFKVIVWDLKRLKKLWQSLSGYCHAQASPTETLHDLNWFSEGLSLIDETFQYFKSQMTEGATSLLSPDRMIPEARMIWEDFSAHRINEEQVLIRLKIVQPARRA
ncbi:MAG: hypothetical protein PHD54_06160 [Desulfuromonadaceae bacterium]|nr:hypothetical protein [Desulfuromonadaceae bacterium]